MATSGVLFVAQLLLLGVAVLGNKHHHHHHGTHHGWKQGMLYQYEMRGRNVAGLHQVSNQFVGLLTRGYVNIQARSNGRINVQLEHSEHMELHANLSKGWRTFIPDEDAPYSPMPLGTKSFDLQFNGGVVEKMWIEKKAKHHEVNILKAVASLLQMDTTGTNSKNSAPDSGSFTTMEDTVSGEVETLYSINPLPEYHLQTQPSLARLRSACPGTNSLLDVRKSLIFNDAHHLPVYHFGIPELSNGIVAGNEMGNMISRSTNNRAVLCGSLDNFLVQSTVTTDKTIVAPHLYNEQKGMVASQFNLTLVDARESKDEPKTLPEDSEEFDSLNYIFNPADSYQTNSRSKRSVRHLSEERIEDDDRRGKDRKAKGDGIPVKPHDNEYDSSTTEKGSKAKGGSGNDRSGGKDGSKKRSIHVNKRSRTPVIDISDGNSTSSSSSSSKDSDSSSSSISVSSSEEYWQPRPSLKSAPNVPFFPFFVGYKGLSVQASKQINGVEIVEKLAVDVSKDIGEPNSITAKATLSKFTSLVQFIQTMNSNQMKEAVNRMFVAEADVAHSKPNDQLKHSSWAVFRDALAQAGTGPALLAIHELIKTGNVKEEDAAELVATAAKMAHYPTEEYVDEFFDMATSDQLVKQPHLNSSAAISLAEIIRRGYASKTATYNHYPVHSFGLPHSRKSKLAEEKYIPYFEGKLNEAILNGDSVKIQTYIWALGLTAHSKALDILKPLINGTRRVSNFQRLAAIASLSEMARIQPKLVRPLMFEIYQNTAESPELRVASVMQLMKTNPPAQLLQRMAEFTNYETSKQVNSAVKAAIETAASQLENDKDLQLSENARSAVDLLTTYEYGIQYSKVHASSAAKKNIPLSYHHEMTRIHSDDSVAPSSVFCSLRRQLGGFTNSPSETFASTSSFSNLFDLLVSQVAEHVPQPSGSGYSSKAHTESSWSYADVAKKLKLDSESEEQVEGNVVSSLFGARRMFVFDNHTINRIPKLIREEVDNLRGPKRFNVSKIFDQLSLKIAMPTAMGLPMIYAFNVPTIAAFSGELQGKVFPDPTRHAEQIQRPKTINATANVNILYSSLSEGKMSFVTPFNQKEYASGLRRQIQFALPVEINANFDFENTKLSWNAKPPADLTKLFEYSTIPYTVIRDIFQLPESPDKEQIINVRPTKKIRFTATPEILGMPFNIGVETQQEFLSWSNIYEAVREHDMMTALMYPFAEEAINFNNFTLAYDGQKSSTARVYGVLNSRRRNPDQVDSDLSSNRKQKSSKHEKSSRSSPSDEIDAGFDSQDREIDMIRKAVVGLNGVGAQYYDMSMKFVGEQNERNIITSVAVGDCEVCEQSRTVVYSSLGYNSKNDFKVYGYWNTTSPMLHLTNFQKAANEEASVKMNGELNFGGAEDQSKLMWTYKMSKSQERSSAIKAKELAKVCENEMNAGYWLQPSCRNLTSRAGFMDKYQMSLNYENIPPTLRRLAYISYAIARYYVTDYMSEDLDGSSPASTSGQINAKWTVSTSSKNVNVSITSPAINVKFSDVPINPLIGRPIIVVHPYYSAQARVLSKITRRQYFPTCSLEGHLVNTFDNRTYPSNFGKCWYAMVHSHPKNMKDAPYPIRNSNFSVLVKSVANSKREMMVILDNNTIHLTSGKEGPAMFWNGQRSQLLSNRVSEFWDEKNRNIFTAYLLPDNVAVINSDLYQMQVMYESSRILVHASNSLRARLRGLCGNLNGEKIDDLWLPTNCIHDNPYEFASAYIIRDRSCEPLDVPSNAGFKCLRKDDNGMTTLARKASELSTYHHEKTTGRPQAHS